MSTYYSETHMWVVDGTGTLNTAGVTVMDITFVANNNGDQIVVTDNADKPVTKLICPAGDDIRTKDWGPKGLKLNSLKIATFSGGSTAYIHLRSDLD